MANLIIKSSADNLVLQGSDASPAITVGATGTTTFAENASFTTGNIGTLTSATTFPAGHVLQVVHTVKDSTFSDNSNGFADITGLSATITPASGNKVLVLCTINVGGVSGQRGGLNLVRDSTNLMLSDTTNSTRTRSSFMFNPSSSVDMIGASFNYLDTPGANGSTAYVYKVQGRAEGASYFTVNMTYTDSDAASHFRGTSQITLMEVVA
jgi:hypothetical protein